MKRILYIAPILLLGASACAQDVPVNEGSTMQKEVSLQGTPITADNLADVLDIQRVIDTQVDAYDRQDWALARALLTDQFETTMGQESATTIKADAFFDRAKGYHEAADEFVTHHSNSGYRIFFHDKDHATAFARGVIIVKSTPGGEHASEGGSLRMERWNSYEYGVERTADGWKINKILITYNSDNITSSPKVE